ncbi:MAG: GNAT family N-acetyltransferase [candidate division KSB1 bacterium]|nr:GNAT family N-acetyltransferase [candidate division KSB1 bacterium]
MTFTIRPLEGHQEYLDCVALQEETWGKYFSERVPASILMVSQKIGGVAAGAFAEDGEMVGFVFGISGFRNGKKVHWSDMLAVKPQYRDHGLGWKLKMYQREAVLALGVEIIYWTYDPLEARNAHLNLNKLGAEIDEYVQDMYPSEDSVLHRGIGLDRFVVAWHIQSEKVQRTIAGERPTALPETAEEWPVVNTELDETGRPQPRETLDDLPDVPTLRVEIPENIQQAKQAYESAGRRWRHCTRVPFQYYLARGYAVTRFYRDPESHRCFYVLERSQP